MTDLHPLAMFVHNCPIREHTADGVSVGRCWHHCPRDTCPRHGDVSEALATYRDTGKLTNDNYAKAGAR